MNQTVLNNAYFLISNLKVLTFSLKPLLLSLSFVKSLSPDLLQDPFSQLNVFFFFLTIFSFRHF